MSSGTRSRTVNDYGTARALRKALKPVDEEQSVGWSDDESFRDCGEQQKEKLDESWDWVLTNYDVGTTLPQSLSQELHRLQVLKSYLILDDDREEAFERLTNMASRIFSVPIALVSLVDLGRQWFMSNHGLGDVRETPRNVAFCAHAIQGINDVFVVRDTLEDSRFCDSPLVQGAPFIRFYAGAPLLSPEGYKLGTFCIIDSEPRPDGLSEDEKANLKDFAAMAMKCMVDRRNIISQDDTAHVVACTAHDLLTPLMGVQLSLSLLEEDQTLAEAHRESVQNAVRSSDWLHRICETTMETLRDTPTANNQQQCGQSHHHETNRNNAVERTHQSPLIHMKDFVDSLNLTMESIPKRVPLVVTVDPTVPTRIVSDDLKLFRSSLNLLSNAFTNTSTGSVHFRIRAASASSKDNDEEQPYLIFECTDTGIDLQIAKEDEQYLFKPSKKSLGVVKDLGLYSVAYQVDSLGGSYGYRSRAETEGRSGSVFWFRIPIVLPEDVSLASAAAGMGSVEVAANDMDGSATLDSSVVCFPAATTHHPQNKDDDNHNINNSSTSTRKKRFSGSHSSTTVEQQAARSAGILAVAAAAANGTSKSVQGSGSCCGLDELAKFDNIEAYKDYQRRNRSKSPSTPSLYDRTTSSSTTKASTTTGGEVCSNKKSTAVAALWNSVQTKPKEEESFSKSATAPERKVPLKATNGKSSLSESVPKTILISKDGPGKNGVIEARPTQSTKGPRQKKALVIEDTLVVRKTLTRALQKRGYEVSQAKDGLEGLDALKKDVFDITLCDFLMPNMDGLDCVSAYRQWEQVNRPFKLYIVGISAHVSQKDVDKGLEIGMNDFRAKPITMKTLQELDESAEMDLVRVTLSKMCGGEGEGDVRPAEVDFNPAVEPPPTTSERSVATQRKSCLMATARSDAASGVTANKMRNAGWDVTIVQNGETALDSLKSRNWGAVVLDDNLPNLSGNQCVELFRAWESQNRVNRQDNLFIVCTDVILSNPDTCMLPPAGFDGAVDGQVSWSHLQSLITKDKQSQSMPRDGLSIVTR